MPPEDLGRLIQLLEDEMNEASAELRFEEAGPSSCVVRVHAFSTGMLPLLIPLAPLLNILLIFFPFRKRASPPSSLRGGQQRLLERQCGEQRGPGV